jgi:tetratricopeptide (TPR) repeat protein
MRAAKSIIDAQIVGLIVYVRQAMIREAMMILLLPATVQAGDANLTEQGIAEFTAAYQAWDGAGFAKAAATFEHARAAQPKSVTNLYWKGVADFHRVLQLCGDPTAQVNHQAAAAALEEALGALTQAIRLDPQHAESHALLSVVYGLSIGVRPVRAVWLGPRLSDQEKQARKLSPSNPRVLYLAGMNRYYGPALLGGKSEALKLLLAAEKQFEAEAGSPAGPVEPRWGRSACLVYIGKTYDALGKPAEAERYFEKALKLNPHDKLAQSELEKRKK